LWWSSHQHPWFPQCFIIHSSQHIPTHFNTF
jgi:hypothetical protein